MNVCHDPHDFQGRWVCLVHRYLRYLYSFLYRKSVFYSKCFYRAFFEELGPFKVREPSAKGRRAAATKEEDEAGSNSSSNGSGVPGPAEKVTFLSLLRPNPSTPLLLPGGSLVANHVEQRAVDGQQSKGKTACSAQGHRRRLALQVTLIFKVSV